MLYVNYISINLGKKEAENKKTLLPNKATFTGMGA